MGSAAEIAELITLYGPVAGGGGVMLWYALTKPKGNDFGERILSKLEDIEGTQKALTKSQYELRERIAVLESKMEYRS